MNSTWKLGPAGLGLVLALTLASASGVRAQPGAGPGPAAPHPTMGMTPEQWQEMHDQMMAEMRARQEKLDALVAKMNAATGPEKVDAIAAVVTELVAQHKEMHGRMWQVHPHGMKMMQPGAPAPTAPEGGAAQP